jgi:hypothetical protein
MYIPDPIERIQANIESLIDEWNIAQKGVPEGSFRCPDCQIVHSYSPIQVSANPDSPLCCYDCLPDDIKKKYDEFESRQ